MANTSSAYDTVTESYPKQSFRVSYNICLFPKDKVDFVRGIWIRASETGVLRDYYSNPIFRKLTLYDNNEYPIILKDSLRQKAA